jgi:cobalt-zinc-cadmium efflux system outer membrane protein
MKNQIPFVVILGGLVFASACATTVSRSTGTPGPTPSKKPFIQNSSPVTSVQSEEPSGVISLDDALQAALKRHPSLAAAWHEIKAREGAARQAGLLSNPSLTGEFEEFGGSGDYSGTDLMSSKIGISQEFPLGGKRAKRVLAANAERDLSVLERNDQIIALRTEVKKRFDRVYMLQEKLKLEQENLRLVQASCDAVSKRVSSGEASPLDEAKIAVELASSSVAVERVRRELDAARYALASSWAGETATFVEVRADYSMVSDLPSENELLENIKLNPACRILEKKVALASASFDLAQAEGWMDIEIGGGIQQFEETDDHAYFVVFSIPFPIFDRNQGGIQEARETLNKATKKQEAGMLELKKTLIETSKRLNSLQYAFLAMQNTVLPAAEKAFISVQKGYMAGEQDYLEFIEAQHILLETRQEQLGLLAEVQELRAELDRLTAESLHGDEVISYQ